MTDTPGQAAGEDDIDLSVIVPVFNAVQHLPALVEDVLSLGTRGVRCQLILVDDGSEDGSDTLVASLAGAHPEILALSNGGNRGAGIARNTGWARARGRYTLFFDADDKLHPDVVKPVLDLMDRNAEVDVGFCGYLYDRGDESANRGMNRDDRTVMADLLKGGDERIGPLDHMASLLAFTNYPWNKIIRTAHFRETGYRFGGTKVHNDILGHWMALLLARRILLTDKVLCTHIVHPGGTNLTNRSSRARFDVFEALHQLYDLIESHPGLRFRYSHYYWAFAMQLMGWVKPRVAKPLHPEFNDRLTDLVTRIRLDDLSRLRLVHNRDVAQAVIKKLLT